VGEAEQAEVAKQLSRRRSAAAEAWDLADQLVLIGAGDPIHVPGRYDLTYPFRAHTEYYYLTDRNRPGGLLVFDPNGGWLDFAAPISAAERLWLGTADDEPADTRTTDQLPDWLASRGNRPIACLGVVPDTVRYDAGLSETLRDALNRIRRRKDALELERMRTAERATRAAFETVIPLLQDGTTERAAQVELEAAAFRAGGDAMAYDTILASGPNSAALHFAPTSRRMRQGELVLIDAGAERLGYASDVTRTFPVGGELSAEQQELHSLVRAAELASIERCGPGTEWRDVHLTAAETIADGLVSIGVLRGQTDSLIETGAVWLFFPHGVGHMVGLGVRDAGGILAERRDDPPPFPHLRIDLPLEPGMVVTVEPGVYFVPALLQDPEQRSRFRDQVVWDRVDRMLDFGGIRIEDNVLVTNAGYEAITRDVPLLG
jgi:Xaa-Pro aminopeptidase